MSSDKGHIHLIAIGGSAMHNLAIALKKSGYKVSGSDDDIFEPSRSRLADHGLLPSSIGWHPDRITEKTDTVILGMHARENNPELKKAKKLNIPICSFPEFIYRKSKNARRIVIAGSHGKTTITSMILHVLKQTDLDFDYLVGAGIHGFDNMVKISGAPLVILEGDEYLSSTLDRTPKFIRYKHQTGLISGIAWDHINAFPTKEEYIRQFDRFIGNTPGNGILIYNEEDKLVKKRVEAHDGKFSILPYRTPAYRVREEKYYLQVGSEEVEVGVFGKHNMQNLSAATAILKTLGLEENEIIRKIASFRGASNRLEKISDTPFYKIYKDFAHSPSKVKSTTRAVREMYPDKKIINCFELHTYSSLNRDFLAEYNHCLEKGDVNLIFLNDHTLEIKKMEYLDDETIKKGFSNNDLRIIRNADDLEQTIIDEMRKNTILLLMSSGNFGGLDLIRLINQIKYKF